MAEVGPHAVRIVVLSPSLDRAGGIERYVKLLRRSLAASQGPENVLVVELAETSGSNGVGVTSKVSYLLRAFRDSRRFKPDLIVCAHVGFGPVGMVVGSLLRTRHWVIVHGIEVWGSLPPLKQRSLHKANRLVAVSNFTANRVTERHGVPRDRIKVVSGAFDSTIPIGSSLAEDGMLGPRKPRLLTVARLSSAERYKGHDVVLRALPRVVEEFPDVVYTIVGEGDDKVRLERIARETGVENHVRFLGRVSEDRLARSYREASVFVLPARTVLDDAEPKGEGFGITFLEAMAFGLPVIGPRDGAPAEFMEHGRHGLLVEPTDPDSVADAVLEMLRSPSETARMGREGRRLVESRYSSEAFARRWSELIDAAP